MAVTVSTLCCVSPAIAGTQCTPPRGVRAAAAACRGGRASVSGAAASFATLGARRAVAGGAASSLARDSRVTLALRAPKQRRTSVVRPEPEPRRKRTPCFPDSTHLERHGYPIGRYLALDRLRFRSFLV
jgi:hypothetical protein